MSEMPTAVAGATRPTCLKCGQGSFSFELVEGPVGELNSFRRFYDEVADRESGEMRSLEDQLQTDLAEQARQQAEQTAALKEEYQAKMKALPQLLKWLAQKKRSTHVETDEAAFLLMTWMTQEGQSTLFDTDDVASLIPSHTPQQTLQQVYREKRERLRVNAEEATRVIQAKYADRRSKLSVDLRAVRDRLVSDWDTPAHRLAIVFCTGCGHVIAAAEPPGDRVRIEEQVIGAIKELAGSIRQMHSDLVACLSAVAGRLESAETQVVVMNAKVAAMNAREESRDQTARMSAAAAAADRLFSGNS